MKNRLPLLLIFFLISHELIAQTEPGNRFRGYSGSLGLTQFFANGANSGAYQARFGYQSGKFTRENGASGWVAGTGLTWNHLSEGRNYVSPRIELAYFVRHYLTLSQPVRAFAELSVGGAYSAQNGLSSTFHTVSLDAGIGVGLTYFIKPGLALEARTNLASATLLHGWPDVYGTTSLGGQGSLGFNSFSVGITRYFGGNQSVAKPFSADGKTFYTEDQRYLGASFGLGIFFDRPDLPNSSYIANNALSLSVGHFIRSNRVRGHSFSVGFREQKNGLTPTISTFSLGYRSYREYYWALPLRKLTAFVNAGISTSYSGLFTNGTDTHTLGVTPSGFPGLQYQLLPKWALAATVGSATLGNLNITHARNPETTYTQATLSLNPTVSLNSFGLSLRYFPSSNAQ